MGRPSITLTPGDLTKLEEVIHTFDGNADIATYLGVSTATIKRWTAAGAKLPPGDPDFRRQFCTIVQHAREGSKRTLLGVVTDIAINGETEATRLSASKYLLDRVHRLAQHVAVQNPDGSPLATSASGGPTADQLAKLPTEQLEEFHAAQAKLLELGQRAIESDTDD